MKNKIITFFLFLLTFLIYSFFVLSPKSTNAVLVEGGTSGGGTSGNTKICISNYNSGTSWEVKLIYTDVSTGDTYKPRLYSGYGYCDNDFQPGTLYDSNDRLQWLTACVDPISNIKANINVSCRSYDAYNTGECKNIVGDENSISCGQAYGACGGPYDYPVPGAGSAGSYSDWADGYGQVAFGTCPIPNDHPGLKTSASYNNFRCAYQGNVSRPDKVGCRNSCHYQDCTSGGNWREDRNSPKCDSVPGCGAPPCTAPGTPSGFSESSSCNSNDQANLAIDWSNVTGANSYDIRWGPSSTNLNSGILDTGGTSAYTIPASQVNNNTTYYYQARATKTCGGGTNGSWSSVQSGTTRSCVTATNTPTPVPSTRDLVVSGFTFPGGNVGSSVNPTVRIRNQGNTDITGSFDVRVRSKQNGSGNNRTVTITADMAGGQERDISSNFTGMTLPVTAGNYTADATVDSGSDISESNESNNTATDAYSTTEALSSIYVNAYNDPTGNCSGTTRVAGARVSMDGGQSQSVAATNPGYTYSNVSAGTHTLNLTPPTNYNLASCSSNPKSRTVPPNATVNYYVQQDPPECTSLTTSRSSVNPGQNATLTVNGCPANVNYTWYTPGPGTFSGQSNNTIVWNSPNPYYTDTYAYPSVMVCFSGGGSCSAYALSNGSATSNPPLQGIHIVPLFSVTGNLFEDVANSQSKGAQSNFAGSFTITRNPAVGAVTTYQDARVPNYRIDNLTPGSYTVSLNPVPSGYSVTYPLNGPPPSFNITVGAGCSENSLDASCDVNGNINGLNFGVTNVSPWIQAEGSDIRAFSGSFINQIPPGAPSCGSFSNLDNATSGTPGLIFSSGSQDHQSGAVSSKNWKVTGSSYDCSGSKTTYSYIKNIVTNNGITPQSLPGCVSSGNDVNCNTASWGSLANGVYEVNVPNGTVNINGSGYTFPTGKDYVILVNGKIKINEEIHVPNTSTATFASTNDLTIAGSIGVPSPFTSKATNLEGWYTTQGRVILENTNSCPTASPRLNVGGAIVACGGFTNERNLCGGNAQCPSFYIKERVDFILNAPEFLMPTRRVYQEVAP